MANVREGNGELWKKKRKKEKHSQDEKHGGGRNSTLDQSGKRKGEVKVRQ